MSARGKPRVPTEDTAAEANARLTGSTGLVLLALFVVQVSTVVMGVMSHLTLHVFIGLLLVPPLVVKIAAASRRFTGYYRHKEAYRRGGTPPLALRILGPVLLVTTLVLFTSGITQLLAPSAIGGNIHTIHSLSAYAWLVLVLAHLAGHARDLRRVAVRDFLPRARAAVPGAVLRQAAILVSLAAGVALALSLVSHAGTYRADVSHRAGLSLAAREPFTAMAADLAKRPAGLHAERYRTLASAGTSPTSVPRRFCERTE